VLTCFDFVSGHYHILYSLRILSDNVPLHALWPSIFRLSLGNLLQALHRVVTISSLFRSSHNVFLVYFGLHFNRVLGEHCLTPYQSTQIVFGDCQAAASCILVFHFLTEFWGNLCNPGLVSCPYLIFGIAGNGPTRTSVFYFF